MSGPYRPGYPGNGGTPLNPGSKGAQPVSFKTDINRKKTKKWVAAKSVSYDGDDWGDDDEDEDYESEEEEVPGVPPLPNTSRFPSSTAHQPEPLQTRPNLPSANVSNTSIESSPTQSPAPARPADIYSRVQEENERTPISQEPTHSNSTPAPAPPPHNVYQNATPQNTGGNAPSESPLTIPEVRRLSGFGQDFLGDTSNSSQTVQPSHTRTSEAQAADQTADRGASLHHNPSMGFNSVVHQAFDAAETPSSSTGYFSRSNSDSTSIISPIVGPWKSETDKTPTIAEDPTAEATVEPPAGFKPGHRRDLSIPSPGNGPDRVPTVVNTEETRPAEVDISSSHGSLATPEYDNSEFLSSQEQGLSGDATPRPLSTVLQNREHIEPETNTIRNDITQSSDENRSHVPSPLQIPEEHLQNIPEIVPASPSTETSPQDMESDRLRREIMRSFSSEHVPAISSETHDQNTGSEEPSAQIRQSMHLPSGHDSSWDGQQGIPPTIPLQLRPAVPPTEPSDLATTNQDQTANSSNDPVSNPNVPKPRPKLKKRFSWEASDDSEDGDVLEEPPVQTAPSQPAQTLSISETATSDNSDDIPLPMQDRDVAGNAPGAGTLLQNRDPQLEYSAGEKEVVENIEKQPDEPQGELSHIPPIPEPVPEPQSPTLGETKSASLPSQTQPSRAPVNGSSLPSFRKIMEIPSSSEKIRVFKETREQFANIESGLSDWIRRSSESLPEHADLIQANGRLPGGAPTTGLPPKAKFPKLSSLGNLSLPTTSSHSDGGASGGRMPSASPLNGVMNRQNVETRGKDLLHSAGVLGGKAGGAARGLFSKGKSKLRGADKGVSSVFRGQRRRSWTGSNEPDPQFSGLDPVDQEPASLSFSSRYSLQPVPRIPSLRLGDSKSFRSSFDGEDAFSLKSRAFSLDLGHNLRSVTEEETTVPEMPSPSTATHPHNRHLSQDENTLLSETSEEASGRLKPGSYLNINFSFESNARDQGQIVGADSVSVASPDSPTSPKHQLSQPPSQGLEPSQESNQNAAYGLPSPTAKSAPTSKPTDKSVSDHISRPPLQYAKMTPAEYDDQRKSVDSKVSDISEDEMERIREKFDEEGLYGGPKEPSPTRSQVSDITSDDDEDEDDALREKLDEAGYKLDPEKDAWEQFPRPPTSSPGQNKNQPIRVVTMTPFSDGRNISPQIDENDTKRFSRFSFESEGNTLAEARLSDGHGQSIWANSSQGASGLQSSQIPVTMGEDAPDEAPPPFPNPEADYGDDNKQQQDTPAYNNTTIDHPCENMRSNEAKDPPSYQDLQSAVAAAAASLDQIRKTDRLQELRTNTNRGSIASSSISALSSPTANSNFPRTAISPEPHVAESSGHVRVSQDSQGPRSNLRRMDVVPTAVEKPGRSLWSDGRIFNRTHARTKSDSPLDSNRATLSFLSGKREVHSLDSGDSAAMWQSDIPGEPSSVNQGSETASPTSDHSSHARLSTQFRNRIKVVGKRFQDSVANIPPVEREAETKPAEKNKAKKTDGKKGVPLSRISGLFNRPGANQQAEGEQRSERNTSSPSMHQNIESTSRNTERPLRGFQPAVKSGKKQKQQQLASSPAAYSRRPPMPAPDKPLPPPPVGYYAPAPQSHQTPVQNRPIQKHPHNYNPPEGYYAPARQSPQNPAQKYSSQNHPSNAKPPERYYAPTRQSSDIPAQSHPSQTYSGYADPSPQQMPAHYSFNQPQRSYYTPDLAKTNSISSQSVKTRSPPVTSAGTNSSTSPDPEESRSRARDLRMRSRSPRPSPVRSIKRHENVNYSDPIYHLGKFNAVTETDRIGDQSLPFPITLPEDLANGQLSPRNSVQPESMHFANNQLGQNTGLGLQHQEASATSLSAALAAAAAPSTSTPPRNAQMKSSPEAYHNKVVQTKNTIPIELPVPNEDEEEIVMSSTAYPGQEWQPAGFEHWMPY